MKKNKFIFEARYLKLVYENLKKDESKYIINHLKTKLENKAQINYICSVSKKKDDKTFKTIVYIIFGKKFKTRK